MYGLSPADLDLQARARTFVDELIPLEVEAELAGGHLPDGRGGARTRRGRSSWGCYATNMPVEVGGLGCTTLQQVLVQEQCGRATNGLGWVMAHAAGLAARGRHAGAGRALGQAGGPRGDPRVLRHHRGGRRLRRRRDHLDGQARRRRLRHRRRQVARHVVQRGRLRLRPGPARRRRVRRPARDVHRRPALPGVRVVRTPAYTHTLSPRAPDRRLRGRPGAGGQPGRRRGRRDDLRLRVVPVRAADGRRALPRCRRPPGRGGHVLCPATDRAR